MKKFRRKIRITEEKNKIFCIGLPKTATTTLDYVFSELGYKCVHNPNIYTHSSFKIITVLFINRILSKLTKLIFNKQRSFIKKTFSETNKLKINLKGYDNYDVYSDMPIAFFYKELDSMYPNSKFILTLRDKESWLKSCQNFFPRPKKTFFMDGWGKYQQIHFSFFGSPYFDQKKFSRSYDNHLNDVMMYFKNRKEDLLLMDIVGGDGYEKLCPFLGLKTINKKFPQKNIYKERFGKK